MEQFKSIEWSNCNAKEVFLEIMEFMTCVTEDIDQLDEMVTYLQQALIRITRKQEFFLRDAIIRVYSLYLSQVTTLRAMKQCISFIEPLVQQVKKENVEQKQLLVAFLLALLQHVSPIEQESTLLDWSELTFTIIRLLSLCHIDFYVIIQTQRWRDEYNRIRKIVLPGDDQSFELDDDEDIELVLSPEDLEIVRTDLFSERAFCAPDDPFRQFWPSLIPSDLITAWSSDGIRMLVQWMWCNPEHSAKLMPIHKSPQHVLYLTAPYLEALLNQRTDQDRICGIQALRAIAQQAPGSCISVDEIALKEIPEKIIGFENYITVHSSQHYFPSLVQCLVNAMVSVSGQQDRTVAYETMQMLIGILNVQSRFPVLVYLARFCPYPNVQSLLIDRLRTEVTSVWNSPAEDHSTETRELYMAPRLKDFLNEMLVSKSDAELIEYMDVYVSTLSLYRFLLIRDKTGMTELREEVNLKELVEKLEKLFDRIQNLLFDAVSLQRSREQLHCVEKCQSIQNNRPQDDIKDVPQLMIFQASIQAVLDTV